MFTLGTLFGILIGYVLYKFNGYSVIENYVSEWKENYKKTDDEN